MGDMMDGLSQELTAAGFIIYPHGVRYAMMKVATPLDERVEEATYFDTYEDAADKAQELYVHRQYNFTAIVRYNRGLGIEYRNIENVYASDSEEAMKIARQKAEEILGEKADIREVRLRVC